jgi:hypothetical protein
VGRIKGENKNQIEMAKTRMVNTRFWNDSFISQLDPIGKLLFIYFITNEHTNICGIYELPLKIAAVETGIDSTMFVKILPNLKGRIDYINGWVCIKNFPKHQSGDNPKIKIGIEREMMAIPKDILEKAIAYGYPMVDSSHSDLDLDSDLDLTESSPKAPTSLKEVEEPEIQECDEDGNPLKVKKVKTTRPPITPRQTFKFDYGTALEGLKVSKVKADKIIALYLIFKHIKFDNAEMMQNQVKRLSRPARLLEPYEGKDLLKTFRFCEEDSNFGADYEWGLETVFKKITSVMQRQ